MHANKVNKTKIYLYDPSSAKGTSSVDPIFANNHMMFTIPSTDAVSIFFLPKGARSVLFDIISIVLDAQIFHRVVTSFLAHVHFT